MNQITNLMVHLTFAGVSEVYKCDLDGRLKIPGFYNIITRGREKGLRGGVGLFIKENINNKVRDSFNTFIPPCV